MDLADRTPGRLLENIQGVGLVIDEVDPVPIDRYRQPEERAVAREAGRSDRRVERFDSDLLAACPEGLISTIVVLVPCKLPALLKLLTRASPAFS